MNLKGLLNYEISQNDLLNYYNATIINYNLPNSIRGFVFNYDDINFIIINNNLSHYKKKKTIIHELAHIELNHLFKNKDLFAFHIQDYEDEADRYVKFLLDNV